MEAQSMNPSQQCMLKLELGRPCPSRILMLLSIEDQNQNPILTNLSRKVLSCLAKLNISDEFSDWAGVWVMTTNRSFRNICWVTVMSDQNTTIRNCKKKNAGWTFSSMLNFTKFTLSPNSANGLVFITIINMIDIIRIQLKMMKVSKVIAKRSLGKRSFNAQLEVTGFMHQYCTNFSKSATECKP